jgi:membrane protein YdbS with pleckstrin-like domain
MWRISEAIQCTIVLVLCSAITVALIMFADEVPIYLSILPVVFALILWVVSVVVIPTIRWRNWRYEIGDLEVDLQRGVWTITRTRVPMARIQHVETRRGPLEQRFGLATVILFTAAGANHIPALALPIADNVRDRIAALANTHDDV